MSNKKPQQQVAPINKQEEQQQEVPVRPRSWTFVFIVFLSFALPVILPTAALLFEIHHPEFHSPLRRSGRVPKSGGGSRTVNDFCNFDRLHCCNGSVAIKMPRTVEEVQSIVKEAYGKMKRISSEYSGVGEKPATPLIRVIGAGHSMSPIVCTSPDTEYPSRNKILMSLDNLNIPVDAPPGTIFSSLHHHQKDKNQEEKLIKVLKTFPVDHEGTRPSKKVRAHVWASGGIRLKHLNEKLWELGYGLFNTGMIQEQSIAGVISTAVHGTGIMNTPINQHVVRIDVVLANGTLATFSRESHPHIFRHARMHLGLFGVVVGVAFEVRERYYVRRTEELLGEAALVDALMLNQDAIKERIQQHNVHQSNHYTRTQAWWLSEDQVLVQDMSQELSVEQVEASEELQNLMRTSFLFNAEKFITDLLFLVMTTVSVYIPITTPIIHKLIPLNHLAKRDFVQRSYEAFTHPGINYHSVRYSETELFVPADNAGKAWDEFKKFLQEHKSLSSICNINTINPLRTVAPDDIPLSPSNHRQNSVAFSFTLVYRDGFKQCSTMLQKLLEPFGGRPHWGKWFSPMLKNRVDVEKLYGKDEVEEFSQIVKSVDDHGLFRPMIFEDLFFF